jgi:hypothetical protein
MDKLLRAALAASRLSLLYRTAHAKLMRAVTTAAAGLVAGLFFIFGLLWFDAALWFYCAPKLGNPIAALIAGGAFVLVAVIAVLVIVLSGGGSNASVKRAYPPPPAGPGIPPDLLRDMNGFVRRHQGTILLATALAGLLFGTTRGRR